MKTIPFLSGLIVVLMVLSVGMAIADRVITQDPEVQGISTSTGVNAIGIMTENDALGWVNSNRALGNNSTLSLSSHLIQLGPYIADIPGLYPVYDAIYGDTVLPSQVVYTTGYSEDTMAVNGAVTYDKTGTVSTANKLADQSNVQMAKTATFVAANTGRMTSSEDILMDGAGQMDFTSTSVLCPFAAQTFNFIPPFCNIVRAGSSVDMTEVSLVTNSHERSVAASADVPAEVGHAISVTGLGNAPALGSAQASMNVHIQEGTEGFVGIGYATTNEGGFDLGLYRALKSEDLAYSESSSASGAITSFAKSMNYKSGMIIS